MNLKRFEFAAKGGSIMRWARYVGAGLLIVFSLAREAEAGLIGINFHGGSSNQASNGASVTGAAGAPGFVQSQWNNVAIPPGGQTGSANSLVNDLGATTTASVSWSANDVFDTGIPLSSQNHRLMRGHLDIFDMSAGIVTVSGIPLLILPSCRLF